MMVRQPRDPSTSTFRLETHEPTDDGSLVSALLLRFEYVFGDIECASFRWADLQWRIGCEDQALMMVLVLVRRGWIGLLSKDDDGRDPD